MTRSSDPAAQKLALLSVSNKTGIVDLAHELVRQGYGLLSSGGTAKLLRQAELEVREISELTQFPDILGGRTRSFHPRVFGGLLADPTRADDLHDLERQNAPVIQLVAINLYPIADVLEGGSPTQEEVLEHLDVSNSALLRAAARNFQHVIALCDPKDYTPTVEALRELGNLSQDRRKWLAAKAFHYLAYYDTTVAQFLSSEASQRLPEELVIGLKKLSDLRYGENPHQQAALYAVSGARPWGLTAGNLLQGRDLTYNQYLDMETAWELTGEFTESACVIVKRAVPAGAACAERLVEAARAAYGSDPRGCQGGLAALNREVDEDTARFLSEEFLECIAAPDFTHGALGVLRPRKDLRLVTLPLGILSPNEISLHTVSGGLLIQDKDNLTLPPEIKFASRRQPTEMEAISLKFAWKVVKYARSHAVVLAQGTQTLGIASGQTSRLDAVRLAVVKSQERHPILSPAGPLVLASDSPLSVQCIQEAASYGLTAAIEPGGTSEDRDVLEAADKKGMTVGFTGLRHYRH